MTPMLLTHHCPTKKDKTRVHTHTHVLHIATVYYSIQSNILQYTVHVLHIAVFLITCWKWFLMLKKNKKNQVHVVAISLLASFPCRLCVWAHSHAYSEHLGMKLVQYVRGWPSLIPRPSITLHGGRPGKLICRMTSGRRWVDVGRCGTSGKRQCYNVCRTPRTSMHATC